MNPEPLPWKAQADVLSVTRPTAAILDRMRAAVDNLALYSPDPACRFFTETRMTDAKAGPALVVTDVAEYEGGSRQSAVVVSAVVSDDQAEDREVVIRTHLEQQHTRHDDGVIVFDAHHDAIRGALLDAVRDFDPGSVHRQSPEPEVDPDAAPTVGGMRVQRAQPRVEASRAAPTSGGRQSSVDPRQLAGIALLLAGVGVLLWAIAVGGTTTVVLGVIVAVAFGFAGNYITGA